MQRIFVADEQYYNLKIMKNILVVNDWHNAIGTTTRKTKYRFTSPWGITASVPNVYPYHGVISFNTGDVVSGYLRGSVVMIDVPAELARGVNGTITIGIDSSILTPVNLNQFRPITLRKI